MHEAIALLMFVHVLQDRAPCGNFDYVHLQNLGNLFISCNGCSLELHSPDLIGVEEEIRKDRPQNFKEFSFGNKSRRRALSFEWETEKFPKKITKCDITDTTISCVEMGQ